MAYEKTEWKDQNVENPRTYSVRDNEDGTVTLLDAFGQVTELGTPVNAENMNHIEDGIANNDAAITQEIADRKQADTQLQTQLNAKQTTANLSQSLDTSTTKYPSNAAVKAAVDAIDVNADIKAYISTVYPVGSLYFSTASTCPLESLGIGTWNKVGTSLTLSVNTDVKVIGNGTALGLTNGTQNAGMIAHKPNDTAKFYTPAFSDVYGKIVGTDGSIARYPNPDKALGLTTDPNKSGIVGTVTRTQITVNVFQRTA